MSEIESRFVKKGYWLNQALGPVMGKTLTTDSRSGAIVIALLAGICALGLTHLWNLLVFGYHQLRADGRARDGLFRQQQSLYRYQQSHLQAQYMKLTLSSKLKLEHIFSRMSRMTLILMASLARDAARS